MSRAGGGARQGRVTIADVARAAEVDPSVVSRVINNDGRLVIKDTTRARVLAAIRDLNYHPNAAARSLRISHSGTFGLLIPDFSNPIYAKIIAGAESAATERDALLLVGSAIEDRPERYVSMLASGRVDGLLLAVDRLSAETVQAMVATGRPIVSVNQRVPGVDRTILADDEEASRIAFRHLYELGHRRIAFFRGPESSDTATRRLGGFRDTLTEFGISSTDGPAVDGGYTTEAGVAAVAEFLALDDRPTGVVVANVAAAIGAMSAFRAAGVRIPEDVSLVAIHDIPLADHLAPALTTVSLPLTEIGAIAVEILDRVGTSDPSIAESDPETVVRSPTELIERQSTCPPRARRAGTRRPR